MLEEFIIAGLAAAIFALVIIAAVLENRFRREKTEFTARIGNFRSVMADLRKQNDLQAGRIAIAENFDRTASHTGNALGLAIFRLSRELFRKLSDHGHLN